MGEKEATMRRTTAAMPIRRALPLPRGWIILGLALASWAVVTGLWAGLHQLSAMMLAGI
jgi:hypothetical protein